MKISCTVSFDSKNWKADLSQPIDISLSLKPDGGFARCFYSPPFKAKPVIMGDFVGSTRQGGAVNFYTFEFTPHGNGTHTECLSHIATSPLTLNQCLHNFHFVAKLVSLKPESLPNGDSVIGRSQLSQVLSRGEAEALVIRTLPNSPEKISKDYSGTNPAYLHFEAVSYLVACGIKHLLIDLPSVDKEEDGGKLLGHRVFWNMPEGNHFESREELYHKGIRQDCTITEMIFVPELIPDGFYLLNLQTASFEMDVSPSKPVLFALNEILDS